MASSVLSTKGQITIPAEVRESLGLKTGDRVYFEKDATGCFRMVTKTGSIQDLVGMLKYDGPPVSIEEMNEAVGRYLGEEDERIKREWNEWNASRSKP